jgi:poly(ADP-ribose) glycohydrolase ARH3
LSSQTENRVTLAKARGLLLAAAAGDALGAAFEGWSSVDGDALMARERATDPLRFTDDTVQALVVVRHVAERHGDVDREALAKELAQAWAEEPERGYGSGARQVLEQLNAGIPWSRATRAGFPGGSFGNGAAMRAAPLALVATSAEHAAQLGRETAAVTHAHPHGQEGAAVQACAAYLALHSDPARPLDRGPFLDGIIPVLRSTEWDTRVDHVRALLARNASPSFAADELGNGASALQAVPAALHAFLQDPDHPGDVVRYAIRAGGDTDTTASMAGALAGARTGTHGLPANWLARLENQPEISQLAERFGD